MAIVGERPESGIRIVIERPREGGPPWIYRGSAFTPEAAFLLSAVVEVDGEVRIELASDAPGEIAEKVRLMVRTLYKQVKADGEAAPARKIVRWRGEK